MAKGKVYIRVNDDNSALKHLSDDGGKTTLCGKVLWRKIIHTFGEICEECKLKAAGRGMIY